jgi:hypothetical protein
MHRRINRQSCSVAPSDLQSSDVLREKMWFVVKFQNHSVLAVPGVWLSECKTQCSYPPPNSNVTNYAKIEKKPQPSWKVYSVRVCRECGKVICYIQFSEIRETYCFIGYFVFFCRDIRAGENCRIGSNWGTSTELFGSRTGKP